MELETPEGANYSLAAVWLSYTGDMETVEFSGALEDKSLYFLGLVATPLPGYEFAEDVGFIVDGETAEGAFRMASAEIVMLLKQYSFGLTEIATVELTVAAPAVGKQPGEVTWPEEAPYILEEISWGVSDTDDLFSTEDLEANAVFEAGKHYWLSGTLQAEEGYVFAENVVITVNGQPMDKSILGDFAELPMVLGNMGVVLYDFGMLEEVVQPGDGNENEDKPTNTDKPADKPVDKPADTSPDTGDRTAMPLALTLMLLATAIVWGFKSQSVRA